MGRRLHSLLTEAWHVVLLVAAAGLVVAGVAALIGLAVGEREGHEVVTVVIALGMAGIVSVLLATILDPMGVSADIPTYGALAAQGELIHEEETGLPPERKKQFRRDDVLYGGGVLLIGLAVLVAFVCKWAGVPPAYPFSH